MSERVDTAKAQGIKLERIAANPQLLYLPKNAGFVVRYAKDVIARMLGRKYKSARSSTLQSLERGRKTEVDYLNGYVVDIATRVGVNAPINKALTRMIKEIESGARKIAKANIDELAKIA